MTTEQTTRAIDNLRRWYPDGATIYAICRHVSRSGLQRHYQFLAIGIDDTPGEVRRVDLLDSTRAIAIALRLPMQDDRIVMRGAGYDAAQQVTADLAQLLHADPRALRRELV